MLMGEVIFCENFNLSQKKFSVSECGCCMIEEKIVVDKNILI